MVLIAPERIDFYASCFARNIRTEDRLCIKVTNSRTTKYHTAKTYF